MSYGPAFLFFVAFAWFELISTVAQSPEILAHVVADYFCVGFCGILVFGKADWLRYGEAFSVFFRIVSWLSPLNGRPEDPATGMDEQRAFLTLPGLGLLHVRPLPMAGVAFVIFALSAVSFDGLSKAFWWLGLIGVNPLMFPGRSAVALPNTLGLLALYELLMSAFRGAIWLGHLMAGRRTGLDKSLGGTVISVVPIALGYHFAHYLTALMLDAQYAAIVATIGLLYTIQQTTLVLYGPDARAVEAPFCFRVQFPWFGYSGYKLILSGYKLIVAGISAGPLLATWLALSRTQLGLYMRATQ